MDKPDVLYSIANVIINDLEFWDNNFRINDNAISVNYKLDGSVDPFYKSQTTIRKNDILAAKEPFNAYVKILNNGVVLTYYFCRRAETAQDRLINQKQNVKYVSYKAPLGRLASLEVGNEITMNLPRGECNFKILEKNINFKPIKRIKHWDAIQNKIEIPDGQFSVDSLLSLLNSFKKISPVVQDVQENIIESLESLEKEELEKLLLDAKITKGFKREIIQKVEFRDQAILDSIQDEIFRLPLNTQIIVNGTAGSGKTTVILKRLSQKIEYNYLTQEEKDILNNNDLMEIYENRFRKWILFTPNSDIKNYIREALNLEGLPASEKTLSTWDNMRTILSRKFFVTKIGNDSGRFVRTKEQILTINSNRDLMKLSIDFKKYYQNIIYDKISKIVAKLEKYNKDYNPINKNLLKSSAKIFENFLLSANNSSDLMIIDLAINLERMLKEYKKCRKEFNVFFKDNIEKLNTQNNPIFNQIVELITELNPNEEKVNIESDDEEMDTVETHYYNQILEERETDDIRLKTAKYIKRSIAWYSKNLIMKIEQKHTIYSRVMELLHKSIFDETFFTLIGQNIFEFQLLSIISENLNLVLRSISKYYKSFRSISLKNEDYFYNDNIIQEHKKNKITGLEIDLILNEILRNARLLFNKKNRFLKNDTGNMILEDLKFRFYIQAIVDEATDFSEIQINCMRHLTHPKTDSLVLSGDVMQRITYCGISSWQELKDNNPEYQIYSLKKVYRQSPIMLDIIKKIYENSTNLKPNFTSAFEINDFDPDALRFKYNSKENLSNWIVERINEIYSNFNYLPTVAIFVPTEERIKPLFDVLYDPLYANSIDLEDCYQGKFGESNKVKIFSIEFIKGMEFEVVFIIDIDKIALSKPNLVDKILYVGLTRAASHLAVTYENDFPKKLEYVKSDFKLGDWKSN